MTVHQRERCTGGSCTHVHAQHYAVGPLIWGRRHHGPGLRRHSYGPYTAALATDSLPFYYSRHAGGKVVHRVQRVALVWRDGQVVMVATAAPCGATSCLAQLVDTQDVVGLRPCRVCDAHWQRRQEAPTP